ncbi:MAG: RNA polymerase subunit sigma [Clostridiales bacterium]|nr:RNA polymerase subunit sigma [Clostridiales bacterium]
MRVYSYVMTLCGNREQAEEITQETFFRAMNSGKRFEKRSEESTWLCAIAKNLFTDEMRRRRRSDPLPEDDTIPSEEDIEGAAVNADQTLRIHMILHTLEEPFREVFELRVFGELSFRDIGTVFGKTENWARVTFHRARQKIRERM